MAAEPPAGLPGAAACGRPHDPVHCSVPAPSGGHPHTHRAGRGLQVIQICPSLFRVPCSGMLNRSLGSAADRILTHGVMDALPRKYALTKEEKQATPQFVCGSCISADSPCSGQI